ncbi:hypothetical protein MTO96_045477, partial [Rhipicephalus appendiculatus]
FSHDLNFLRSGFCSSGNRFSFGQCELNSFEQRLLHCVISDATSDAVPQHTVKAGAEVPLICQFAELNNIVSDRFSGTLVPSEELITCGNLFTLRRIVGI